MTAEFSEAFGGLRQLAVQFLKDRVDAASSGHAIEAPLDTVAQIARFRACPSPSEAPVITFCNSRNFTDFEVLALCLCLAAEDDPNIARMVARAQDPVGGSRPVLGLLATVFREFGASSLSLASGSLVRLGLVTIGEERAALPERSVILSPGLAAAFAGHSLPPPGVAPFTPKPIALPDHYHRALKAAISWSAVQSETHAVLLRCPSEADGVAAVTEMARLLERLPVSVTADRVTQHAAWLMAAAALPVIRIDAGPGERVRLPDFLPYQGLLVLFMGFEGTLSCPCPHRDVSLVMPDEASRAALWQAHGADPKTAEMAASAYRQGPARIAELAQQAAPEGKEDVGLWHRLTHVVRTAKSELDGFARRSFAEVERDELILPDAALSDLDMLVERIRQRNRLADTLGLGISRRYAPGVRALFNGESGTGKTMAAHWLSSQSGLPLYRVDQAVLTSKWIGETEKNLAAVLDAAQNADVLLFFDEADALFGARTDVSDANDRHANAQTNYLLQRIEDYEGVVIMATNSRERFDPAFVRRIDSIIAFPMPDSAARLQLWKVHLGECHSLADQVLGEIASTVELSGGHVRNIVLAAAVRANRDQRAIALSDISHATRDEYAKLGRPPPEFAR